MIKAALVDISGVLHVDYKLLPNAILGWKKLNSLLNGKVTLLTNTDNIALDDLYSKLRNIGFKDLNKDQIVSCVSAAKNYVLESKLNPLLLVHPDVEVDFAELKTQNNKFDSVLLGDMKEHMNYSHLNKAFRILMENENHQLIVTGGSRYYKDSTGFCLDSGTFAKALEYASGREPMIMGKPNPIFFQSALKKFGVEPEDAGIEMKLLQITKVMIGDDIVSDVGGAIDAGLRAILVRQGKYQKKDEQHEKYSPDFIADDLFHAASWIEARNSGDSGWGTYVLADLASSVLPL